MTPIFVFLILVFLFSLISKGAEGSILSGPLAFAAAGLLFMGWFDPRGMASVVLGLVYIKEVAHIGVNSQIVLAVIATVLLSILAHGVSVNPGVKLYARTIAHLEPNAPEST